MARSLLSPVLKLFHPQTIKEAIYDFATEYETPKVVTIHSLKFTLLLRVIQVVILLYGVFYLLIYEKGYQKQDTTIISCVTLKVKGIGYTKPTVEKELTIIDVADYVIPALENSAIFIMTSFIRTDQMLSKCEEAISVDEANCTSDEDCKRNIDPSNTNGRWTGNCLIKENATNGLCEIAGWCPAENDRIPPDRIQDILNFTIFLKNFIEFPEFNVIRKNIPDNMQPCIFDENKDKTCPIFRLSQIIEAVESEADERDLMLKYGGVIKIKLDWDCNFDFDPKRCVPIYSFGRLDAKYKDEKFSKGFNFRFASHWKRTSRSYRILTKAFGLRFIISVSGKGGRFDIITLTFNIGSIIGIFGLASILCDIVMLHLCRNAHLYKQHIFQRVDKTTIKSALVQMITAVSPKQMQIEQETNDDHRYSTGKVLLKRSLSLDDQRLDREIMFDHHPCVTKTSRDILLTDSPSTIRPLVIRNDNTKSSVNDKPAKRVSPFNGRVKFQIPMLKEAPEKLQNPFSSYPLDDVNNAHS
ncbi:unnamed protein product [Didymodactylos carnosus]|uniref:ATP receptor n=1 Tax=Didymodactylos carnosus TaxID=1234261 RepID=A0A8S2SLR6_9BILA|nr:unnamed protein product [Didymodactylos carnosus]CAF4233824.1 unnamed protein product [Didymodactylos carnosus]